MKEAVLLVMLLAAGSAGFDSCTKGVESIRPVLLPRPSFKGQVALAEIWVEPLKLAVESKAANKVIDTDEWSRRNGLELPEPGLRYELRGQRNELLFGLDSAGCERYGFDFSNYVLAPDCQPEDRDFVEQEITWAEEQDAILYVNHAHRTYSESSGGMNGYITAIDIRSGTVIWRTEPLVCNSRNFIIHDDAIVCGYGFTAEPDFVYQLNRHTGAVIAAEPVKSAPDYLVEKDGRLYVRCYDTDYVFELMPGR